MEKKVLTIKNLVRIGMCGALAAILMLFEFPIPFIAPTFYEMDLSEIPVLIGTFSMGPIAGILIEFVKVMIKLFIKSTSTAYVGDVANFLVGCFFLLPAGIIYKKNRTKKGALIGMVIGTLTMAAAGAILNAYVLLPFYSKFYGIPLDSLIAAGTSINKIIVSVPTFVIFAVAPFNIIKGAIVSIITLLIYKRVRVILK